MHCMLLFDPNKGRATLCCLYVAVCGSQLRRVTVIIIINSTYQNGKVRGIPSTKESYNADKVLRYLVEETR